MTGKHNKSIDEIGDYYKIIINLQITDRVIELCPVLYQSEFNKQDNSINPGMAGIDQVEFDQIFMDWYYPVRNSVYYKTGDMQAAEDITQETFLKIWERKDTINSQTIGPLLYKISRNLFLNTIEHSKVTLKFINDYPATQYSDPPDFDLEMKDFDRRLQESLSELDEKHRTVFLMNRIDDLTYSRIAEILGLSVKTIEKRMSKAMVFLKDRLNVNI